MGWLTSFGSAAASLGRAVVRNPVTSTALSFVPGGSLVKAGIGLAVGGLASSAVSSMLSSPSTPALPALPGGGGSSGGGLVLPGMPGAPTTMGSRSIFRNDPNVVEALKPFAISMHNLKQSYRAPHGFVVMHDAKGDPYGIPKEIARKYLGWRPAHKPPISVGDWHALKKSASVIKKLRKAEKLATKLMHFKGRHLKPHYPQPKKGK